VCGIRSGDTSVGPPVCPYGYFDYAPYACAPYGYYGPSWFSGGVFIGAGPWYHGYYGRGGRGPRYYGRGFLRTRLLRTKRLGATVAASPDTKASSAADGIAVPNAVSVAMLAVSVATPAADFTVNPAVASTAAGGHGGGNAAKSPASFSGKRSMKYEKPTFSGRGLFVCAGCFSVGMPDLRVPNPFALFANEPALSGAEGVGAEI